MDLLQLCSLANFISSCLFSNSSILIFYNILPSEFTTINMIILAYKKCFKSKRIFWWKEKNLCWKKKQTNKQKQKQKRELVYWTLKEVVETLSLFQISAKYLTVMKSDISHVHDEIVELKSSVRNMLIRIINVMKLSRDTLHILECLKWFNSSVIFSQWDSVCFQAIQVWN